MLTAEISDGNGNFTRTDENLTLRNESFTGSNENLTLRNESFTPTDENLTRWNGNMPVFRSTSDGRSLKSMDILEKCDSKYVLNSRFDKTIARSHENSARFYLRTIGFRVYVH